MDGGGCFDGVVCGGWWVVGGGCGRCSIDVVVRVFSR